MRWMFAVVLILGLGACAATPPAPPPISESEIQARLRAQHQAWRGVPYQIGGLSKRGIDCSGFVKLTFQNQFGSRLPRTTEALAETGVAIEADDRRVGDLLFFKTGWLTRHVGIYLGQGRFLHASKSRGVMISDLDNPYWIDSYWQTRRVW